MRPLYVELKLLITRNLGVLLSRWSTGAALLDEVEYETQRALEWLEVEKSEARRLGAVLILKVALWFEY